MKLWLFLTLLSLCTTAFAETSNCLVNKKFKGVGTLSEVVSNDGTFVNVFLTIDVRYVDEYGYTNIDRWRGYVARKDLDGNYMDLDVKQKHRFSVRVFQKVRAQKLNYEYFNPGLRMVNSQMIFDEAKAPQSIKVKETIYDDYQRVDGRNSVDCRF